MVGNWKQRRELKKLKKEIDRFEKQKQYPVVQTRKKKTKFDLLDGVLVWLLVVFLLALLLLGVIFVLNTQGMYNVPAQGDGENQQVHQGNALLEQTPDAGDMYIAETFFTGDSNTVRLEEFALVAPDQVAAKQGAGVLAFLNEAMYYDGNGQYTTVPQHVQVFPPARMLLSFGTNDIGNGTTAKEFGERYRKVLQAVKTATPETIVVVNSIPPVAKNTSYTNLTNEEIQEFNAALQEVCGQENVAFLNSNPVLADEDGYARQQYIEQDGVHYTKQGLEVMLQFYRTHAFMP